MDPDLAFHMLRTVLLAVLQGGAEVFPISSSGHLTVYGMLLGEQVSFSKVILLHAGTFLAILLFYRRDVIHLVNGKEGWRLPGLMLISFIFTGCIGLILEATIIDTIVQHPRHVAILWIVNGLFIGFVGIQSGAGQRTLSEIGVREFVLIGIAQGLGAIPGVSRLGITLGAGLLNDLSWFEALKLSFLLSLPTILIANLIALLHFLAIRPTDVMHLFTRGEIPLWNMTVTLNHTEAILSIGSVIIAFVVGLVALQVLSRFLGRRLLINFGLYCIVSGAFFGLYLGFYS